MVCLLDFQNVFKQVVLPVCTLCNISLVLETQQRINFMLVLVEFQPHSQKRRSWFSSFSRQHQNVKVCVPYWGCVQSCNYSSYQPYWPLRCAFTQTEWCEGAEPKTPTEGGFLPRIQTQPWTHDWPLQNLAGGQSRSTSVTTSNPPVPVCSLRRLLLLTACMISVKSSTLIVELYFWGSRQWIISDRNKTVNRSTLCKQVSKQTTQNKKDKNT